MVPFQVTEFFASERRAVVTLNVDGTEYQEAVCTVPGKKMVSKDYWTNNRPAVEKTAVGKWLWRGTGAGHSREALAEMLKFVKSA